MSQIGMINDAVLIVDKPSEWTSNDVVQKVKNLLKAQRVGHAGTLDPDATGVLVVCLNGATKWTAELMNHDKVYRACIALGRSTDTGDASGKVMREMPVGPIDHARLEAVLDQFRGAIQQQVPRYAAVKVRGKPLYRWAREQKDVMRPWRRVEIHRLILESYASERITVEVRCSKGTYIRALAEDIGKALGYPAHLEKLRRIAVGPFDIERAIPLATLISQYERGNLDISASLFGRHEIVGLGALSG